MPIIQSSLQSDALGLFVEHGIVPDGCPDPFSNLDQAWNSLALIPPQAPNFVRPAPTGSENNSPFGPRSCLQALHEIGQEGLSIDQISTPALYGLSYRSHMNILGRVAAAAHYLGQNSGQSNQFEQDQTAAAMARLDRFEKDFLGLMEKHRPTIAAGLTPRMQFPSEQAKMPPEELWQPPGLYNIPADLIMHARFDIAENQRPHRESRDARFTELQVEIYYNRPARSAGALQVNRLDKFDGP